ncbi:mitochondrial inner membrane protease subunit 1-like [Diadema setosum]|uniref:mitochondrial inner membrane protease subunit 1-like n=1 Tax=Diadema setosum TaxID=31175 RepID=UPI003B3B5759
MAAKLFGRVVKYSALFYCGAYCVSEYVFDFTLCTGPSMRPTIQEEDIVLTEHISTRFFFNVKRGDIVIFKSPSDPRQFLCKRVVALEFDEIPTDTSWKFLKTTKYIPRGHVWLQGDNTDNSTDSRVFGPVPFGLIRGRAIFRVWPWTTVGWL